MILPHLSVYKSISHSPILKTPPIGANGDNSEEDAESIYPLNCASLGLANCLLSSWDDVAAITRPMSRLQTLHLDENRIAPPLNANPQSLVDAFSNLKVITLTKMDLDW